jgi:cyclic pyranopterin phosphate synthase
MDELSHLNKEGEAKMVDVSSKADTVRKAMASARLRMKPLTLEQIKKNAIKKGDVLAVARVAGIMAAKKTPQLIPLCHPIMLSSVSVDFEFAGDDTLYIKVEAVSTGQTGVEMETLTAASVAALTVYDMVKAVDRGMSVESVRLESKEGGKSGLFRREDG